MQHIELNLGLLQILLALNTNRLSVGAVFDENTLNNNFFQHSPYFTSYVETTFRASTAVLYVWAEGPVRNHDPSGLTHPHIQHPSGLQTCDCVWSINLSRLVKSSGDREAPPRGEGSCALPSTHVPDGNRISSHQSPFYCCCESRISSHWPHPANFVWCHVSPTVSNPFLKLDLLRGNVSTATQKQPRHC